MKRSYLIAALLSTLAMGFFAGRVSSSEKPDDTGKDEAGDPQSKLRTRVADRPNPSITNSSSSRLRQDIRKAAPEKLAAMMAPVMETVDPILRRQLLYDLFERMDAGNFRELTEAMDRAALETGRDNHIEWLLVHTRAGQVAGAEAMKQWDPENGVKITDPGWRTMWGWASNDPDAALQWLNQKEALNPADRAKLLNAIASGAIMRDPAKAADLLSTFSEAEKLQCVGQFTFDIVQNGGKESAISWLQSVRNSEPDSAFAKRVTENVFDKVMYQSINQGSPATMIADLERLSAVMPVNEVLVQRGLSQLRERRPVAGLDFLDQFAQSNAFKDQGVGDQMLSSTVRLALTRDRNGVAEWMAKNTGSSIYPRVAEAYHQSPATPAH